MFKSFRVAYKSGWRSGRCGESYTINPHRNFLLRLIWDNGWYNGIMITLTRWLDK